MNPTPSEKLFEWHISFRKRRKSEVLFKQKSVLSSLCTRVYGFFIIFFRGEEPTCTNMDISTGHMVLAYMEDHLKNKQRLEQEWVGLCSYEAEPCSTTTAFKVIS